MRRTPSVVADKAVVAALSSVVFGEEADPISLLHPSRFLVALGYLQKERYGVVREGWTRRFVALTPNTLFYFRRNDDRTELFGGSGSVEKLYGEARHFIPLQSIHRHQSGALAVRVVEFVDSDDVCYYILHIRAEDRSYRFRSSSKRVVDAWHYAITSRADVFAQLSTMPEMTSMDRLFHSMLKEGALSPAVVAALGSLAGGKSLRSLAVAKEKATSSPSPLRFLRSAAVAVEHADSDSDDREAAAASVRAEATDVADTAAAFVAAAAAAAAGPVSSLSLSDPPTPDHGLVAMGFLEKKKAGKNLLAAPVKFGRGRTIKLARTWGRRFFVLSKTTLHWYKPYQPDSLLDPLGIDALGIGARASIRLFGDARGSVPITSLRSVSLDAMSNPGYNVLTLKMLVLSTDPRALKLLPQSVESMISSTPIYNDLVDSPAVAASSTDPLQRLPFAHIETFMKLRTEDDAQAKAWIKTLRAAIASATGLVQPGTPPLLTPVQPVKAAADFSDTESDDDETETTDGEERSRVSLSRTKRRQRGGGKGGVPSSGSEAESGVASGSADGDCDMVVLSPATPIVDKAPTAAALARSSHAAVASSPVAKLRRPNALPCSPPRLAALLALNAFALLLAVARGHAGGAPWVASSCRALGGSDRTCPSAWSNETRGAGAVLSPRCGAACWVGIVGVAAIVAWLLRLTVADAALAAAARREAQDEPISSPLPASELKLKRQNSQRRSSREIDFAIRAQLESLRRLEAEREDSKRRKKKKKKKQLQQQPERGRVDS